MAEIQITLKAARVNAELKQEDAAKQLGIDRSTLRRWEKGLKVPSYDEVKFISKIYNIPVDNIFFGKTTRLKRANNKGDD